MHGISILYFAIDGQVRLVFLVWQKNKLPVARWENGKRIKENRLDFHFRFPFDVSMSQCPCPHVHVSMFMFPRPCLHFSMPMSPCFHVSISMSPSRYVSLAAPCKYVHPGHVIGLDWALSLLAPIFYPPCFSWPTQQLVICLNDSYFRGATLPHQLDSLTLLCK